jgi:hypothetical protein
LAGSALVVRNLSNQPLKASFRPKLLAHFGEQRSGGTPAFRFAFAVLVVIPEGDSFLSFRSFRKPPLSGCPIHRAI